MSGVALMLGLTVLQRLVGFGRNILFCRWLADDELGRWSLVFGFLVTAAPLAVLGIPGSFGRYAEYYRGRGQLRPFVARSALLAAVAAAVMLAAMGIAPGIFSWLIFGSGATTRGMWLVVATLAAFIVCNFLTELLTGLRQVRVVAWMQLANSLVFAAVGFLLIRATPWHDAAVVAAFAAGSVVAAVGMAWVLARVFRESEVPHERLSQHELWSKLLPFAGWMWLCNLLANLFDAADRYMIVHRAVAGSVAAEALVGQYHSSRVVPVLLATVATMISGILLPHLSHDWEQGRRGAVSARLGLAFKLTSLGLTAAAVAVVAVAPMLFHHVLEGRYDMGLSVLPWTLVYCLWTGLAVLAQNYLWCAERARLTCLALFLGLVTNFALNALLMPYLGLAGVVWATSAATLLVLVLTLVFSRRCGMVLDSGLVIACGVPLVVTLSPGQAALALVLVGWLTLRGASLLDAREKRLVWDAARGVVDRLPVTRRWAGETTG